MRTERMAFPRSNKAVEVSEEAGTKLLKITGFYPSMNEDAKKELAFNIKREKSEKEKLKSGVKIVEIQDDSLVKEIESLKVQLEEAVEGSQLGSLTTENETLVTENKKLAVMVVNLTKKLKDCTAKLTAAEMTSKVKG